METYLGLKTVFGIRTASVHSHHLVELYKVMEEVSKIFEIGATPPIDIFPILKRLPEAMFGNWRARSITAGDAMNKLYDSLVSHVIQRRLNHGGSKSFLDLVLDQKEGAELTRHELNLLCGTMIEGGSETTSSVILAFVHAMLKHPNVQRQAQNEIDGVIGEDRSPAWADYARLPYVAMTVKETMRWRPPDPLGFPHVLDRGKPIAR